MRILFVVIGFIFDLIIFGAGCFVIYTCVQPDVFYYAMSTINEILETTLGRVEISVGAMGFILLVIARFLIALGNDDKTFVINRSGDGTLSVSRSTLESLIGKIVGGLNPPATVDKLRILQLNEGIKVEMKVRLDIAQCNLNEYSGKLDSAVKSYFSESLGINVKTLDIQAALPSGSTGARPPATLES